MRSRKSASQGEPRKRHLLLRIVLILIVVGLCVYILPTPWAFHMGGKFSPLGEWDGYGPVQASNGGRYLLYTHLRGGIVNDRGPCRLQPHRMRQPDRDRAAVHAGRPALHLQADRGACTAGTPPTVRGPTST